MLTLEQLRNTVDIGNVADTILQSTYNTTAVTVLDILSRATPEQLNLDTFEREMYSVILQINSEWVKEAVQDTLNKWEEEHEYATHYINSYLESIGIPQEQWEDNKKSLLNALPRVYATENSPEIYKQYLAVMIIRNGQKDDTSTVDLSEKIFAETKRVIEYSAVAECELEMGTPSKLASAKATERVIKEYEKEEPIPDKGIAGKAGSLVGKVINFKYETANNFEEMFKESLGDHGDEWEQHRAEIKERKEAIKKYKEELKYKQKIAELERKHQNDLAEDRWKDEMRRSNLNTTAGATYQYNVYGSRRGYGAYNNCSNMKPKFPMLLFGPLINVLLCVIFFFMLSLPHFIFCGIGLILSAFGYFMCFNTNKRTEALLTILAGYAITLVSIIL